MQDSIPDNDSRPSLADAMSAIMADPSIIQGALEALKKSGIGAPQGDTPPTPPTPEPSPEALDSGVPTAADTAPVSQDMGELVRTLSPMLSMLSPHQPSDSTGVKGADRRSALLMALRPYLSESRREAIDYIIRVSQVSDLIRKSGR